MNKKLIRLTETDLHRIIKESVNRILNEMGPRLSYHLGRAAARRERVGDIDYAMQMRKHYNDSVLPGLKDDYGISGRFDNTIDSDEPFTTGYLDQKDYMSNVDRYNQHKYLHHENDADDALDDLTHDQEIIRTNDAEWGERKPIKDKLKNRMRDHMNTYRFDNFKD